MNVHTKQKQTHRYKEQTCGYQKGERRKKGPTGGMGLADTNYEIQNT